MNIVLVFFGTKNVTFGNILTQKYRLAYPHVYVPSAFPGHVFVRLQNLMNNRNENENKGFQSNCVTFTGSPKSPNNLKPRANRGNRPEGAKK